ncbi:UNVERIFIED_CONTAM: hypothetical protein FKN15_027881 [Acipenser sinensis]
MKLRWLWMCLGLLCLAAVVRSHEEEEDDDNEYEAQVEDFEEKPTETSDPEDNSQSFQVTYKTPVPTGEVNFAETFDDGSLDGWKISKTMKDDTADEIAKYDGKWEVEPLKENTLPGDKGLVLKSRAKHHAIAAMLQEPFVFEEKPLVVQYEVNFQDGIDCGGAYMKLLSATDDLDLENFYDRTPYTIMFGPDKCGEDYKLHFIFRHKNPQNGDYEEKQAKRADVDLKKIYSDKKTHLYTLVLNPDNSFEIFIDQTSVSKGNLLEDFIPPVNPAKEVDDPNDSKPEDWDEHPKIPNPEETKPDDWDEDAPTKIEDPNAVKPEGWLDDEPEYMSDPNSEKPEDCNCDQVDLYRWSPTHFHFRLGTEPGPRLLHWYSPSSKITEPTRYRPCTDPELKSPNRYRTDSVLKSPIWFRTVPKPPNRPGFEPVLNCDQVDPYLWYQGHRSSTEPGPCAKATDLPVLNPDNSFEIFIDQTSVSKGNLLEDFIPPVNPAKEVDDPNDSKPEDWDEHPKIPNPEETKPDDWDEDAPTKIEDPNAVKPEGWLDDEPEYMSDPNSEKPEDWDEEMDGEWEAPQVPNPACETAPGCGTWKLPMIDNPNYKGKWKPSMIDNPNYQGIWSPRKILNPDYFEDQHPFRMTPFSAVGLELWSMTSDIYFDNFIICSEKEVADRWAADSWGLKKLVASANEPGVLSQLMTAAEERPWLWIVYILTVGLPLWLVVFFCFPKKTDELAATYKKTDAQQKDVKEAEEKEEEEEQEQEEKIRLERRVKEELAASAKVVFHNKHLKTDELAATYKKTDAQQKDVKEAEEKEEEEEQEQEEKIRLERRVKEELAASAKEEEEEDEDEEEEEEDEDSGAVGEGSHEEEEDEEGNKTNELIAEEEEEDEDEEEEEEDEDSGAVGEGSHEEEEDEEGNKTNESVSEDEMKDADEGTGDGPKQPVRKRRVRKE